MYTFSLARLECAEVFDFLFVYFLIKFNKQNYSKNAAAVCSVEASNGQAAR